MGGVEVVAHAFALQLPDLVIAQVGDDGWRGTVNAFGRLFLPAHMVVGIGIGDGGGLAVADMAAAAGGYLTRKIIGVHHAVYPYQVVLSHALYHPPLWVIVHGRHHWAGAVGLVYFCPGGQPPGHVALGHAPCDQVGTGERIIVVITDGEVIDNVPRWNSIATIACGTIVISGLP